MRILLVIVACTCLLFVYGEEPNAKTDAHRQNTAQAAQQTASATDGTIIVVNQQAPEGQEDNHPQKPPSYLSRLFAPENIPTLALVIVGAVGIFYAVKTLRAIERQAKANEDTLTEIKATGAQTDKMIEHAEAQATTARDSLDLSRDTAKKQLRAYLMVTEAMIKFKLAWMVEPQVTIRNSGQTPAYDVRQWLKTKIEEFPPRWLPNEKQPERPEGGTVLGADGKDVMVNEIFVVPEDRQPDFGTKYTTLYVYGRISYTDVFGDDHYTDFRLFYGGPVGGRKIQKNGEDWGLLQRHSEGNGAT